MAQYEYTLGKVIEGIDNRDFNSLDSILADSPFIDIIGIDNQGIRHACEYSSKTQAYTDCRPFYQASGKIESDNIISAIETISQAFTPGSIDRLKLEKIENKTEVTSTLYWNQGRLSINCGNSEKIISKEHPIYLRIKNCLEGAN